MHQFLADQIDQLDLALDQLALGDRNFDRFALMLIDNVVELALHRFAQDRSNDNRAWLRASTPKFDPKAIAAALGQQFDDKVRLARLCGSLDANLAESLLNLHKFRNVVYHQGLRHERILHALALFHFDCACVVLSNCTPAHLWPNSTDRVSHRAMKYIGEGKYHNGHDVFAAAWVRLREVAASMGNTLVRDLHRDMQETITATDECIQFLVDDGPQDVGTRDRAIVRVQAGPFALTDKARLFAEANGCQAGNILDYVDWLAANYPWTVKKDPISSWKRRLASLEREPDMHKALKKYCDFIQQTGELREQIDEAGRSLDAAIQLETDIALGK